MAEMIQVDLGTEDTAPPPGVLDGEEGTEPEEKSQKADAERPKKIAGSAKTKVDSDLEARRPSRPQSKELAEVKVKEDATLRDIVNSIGTEGSYKISVSRVEPEQFRDPHTRQLVNVGGFLKNYYTPVDEEIIQNAHGGGKFRVRFQRKSATNSWVFFTERTIQCVGDPRLDDTFRNVAPPGPIERASAGPGSGDSPTLVNKAFDILTSELGHARNASSQHHERPAGVDLGAQAMMKVFEAQLSALNMQNAELAKQLAEARNQKPVEDPWKNSMLDNFFKDDSSRLQATRAQYESEIRTIKDNHRIDLDLARTNFERDRTELKQMHERELALTRQTHEVQFASAKGTFETSMKLAEHENRRLERENGELKTEVKELRALKQKGPLETIKEAEQIKEALGVGDGEETSKLDQVIGALPGVIDAAKTYFKKPEEVQQAANSNGQALQTKRKIVQAPDGQKYLVDEKGTLTPVTKKKPPPPQPGPNGEPPIPVIAPETIAAMVNYLERAYAGNQDPEVVAQSGRAMIPEEIITAIRDHTVDGFLTKVAKLPGTSPLSNQAGKNWMRKVGKALVGE